MQQRQVASAAHVTMSGESAGKSYGGLSEREIPGPIPNPEVKPLSADGTATERLWESRTSPDILSRRPPRSRGGLLGISGPLLGCRSIGGRPRTRPQAARRRPSSTGRRRRRRRCPCRREAWCAEVMCDDSTEDRGSRPGGRPGGGRQRGAAAWAGWPPTRSCASCRAATRCGTCAWWSSAPPPPGKREAASAGRLARVRGVVGAAQEAGRDVGGRRRRRGVRGAAAAVLPGRRARRRPASRWS